MAVIPAGRYQMGSTRAKPFAIARHPGFNAQRHGYIFPLRTADNKFVSHLELQALWDWPSEFDKRRGEAEQN